MVDISPDESLQDAESAFQKAFLKGDVAALEAILHPDVRYVGPDGVTVDRKADLDARRSGVLVLDDVDELNRQVQVFGSVGVTRVILHLVGSVAGEPIDASLVYTRTWQHTDDGWVVVAAHASLASTPPTPPTDKAPAAEEPQP